MYSVSFSSSTPATEGCMYSTPNSSRSKLSSPAERVLQKSKSPDFNVSLPTESLTYMTSAPSAIFVGSKHIRNLQTNTMTLIPRQN